MVRQFKFAMMLRGAAAEDGVAATPPMGFNNCNVNAPEGCCSADQDFFLAQAQDMKRMGLLDLGYQYINTDDGWMGHDRARPWPNGTGGDGPQLPRTGKFPDFPGMIERLHEQGFKFGLYTSTGLTLTMGRNDTQNIDHD